jgi:hypothetical protein
VQLRVLVSFYICLSITSGLSTSLTLLKFENSNKIECLWRISCQRC